MKKCFLLSFSMLLFFSGFCQNTTMALWPDDIPNSQESEETEVLEKSDVLNISKVQEPNISVYLPSKRQATGEAFVICPGGGYARLAFDWEGIDVAKFLNSKGIAAIVLKYRLPDSKSIKVSYEAPLQDAQRAIRLVRFHSEEWNIDKNKIGVIGFSAGGHLASTLGTQFDRENSFTGDSIDTINARPDFMALIYPVVSMKSGITHTGSRNSLLGENPDEKLVEEFSGELQVTNNTPPTFIVHSTDDMVVPVDNSLLFYKALKEKEIHSEMHIYPEGGHGYSLAVGRGYIQSWTDRFSDWLTNLNNNN